MTAQTRKFLPRLAAILRAEQSGIFHSSVDRVRIAKRRLKVPHPLELPRMLRPVIKLVRGQWLAGFRRSVVHKFIALSFRHSLRRSSLTRWRARLRPRLAAIIRALNDLPEPAAGLRCIT